MWRYHNTDWYVLVEMWEHFRTVAPIHESSRAAVFAACNLLHYRGHALAWRARRWFCQLREVNLPCLTWYAYQHTHHQFGFPVSCDNENIGIQSLPNWLNIFIDIRRREKYFSKTCCRILFDLVASQATRLVDCLRPSSQARASVSR